MGICTCCKGLMVVTSPCTKTVVQKPGRKTMTIVKSIKVQGALVQKVYVFDRKKFAYHVHVWPKRVKMKFAKVAISYKRVSMSLRISGKGAGAVHDYLKEDLTCLRMLFPSDRFDCVDHTVHFFEKRNSDELLEGTNLRRRDVCYAY